MENHGINEILGQASFMTSLADQGLSLTQYTAISHPSQPDYMALIGGDAFVSGDGNCCYQINAQNLIDRLEASGKTWKAFAEDANNSRSCGFSPPRMADHFPFIEFQDIQNTNRCTNFISTQPPGDNELINYLNNPDPANLIWLTPNDCNNMHDCPVAVGDNYLSNLVPQILGSSMFRNNDSALFIVFDEGPGSFPNDFVYAVWSGPTVKQQSSNTQFSHYSLLKTLEGLWNLTSLTSNDASANSMSSFILNQPPKSSLGNFNSDWFVNNCDGAGTGTESISNGILQTREATPLGSDSNFGYCSALRGIFPFSSLKGTPIPDNLTQVSVSLNFLNASLLSGSRYHLFVALYFQIPLSSTGNISFGWLDTQSRAENIGGIDSPVGKNETYNPGDSFGFDIVTNQIDMEQSGNIVANATQLCQGDLQAWGLPLSTPCTLKGIEIGTEGFHIQELDADWFNVTFS